MSTYFIRPARSGDEATIVALLRDLATYEKLLDRFHITEDVVARDYLCEHPLVFCDLLFDGEQPAGIATWYWTYGSFAAARKAYLADLFVRPEFRRMKLGLKLTQHIIDEARSIGYTVMRLDTIRGTMDNAIALYESVGFSEIPAYYHNPIPNAFYMELRL